MDIQSTPDATLNVNWLKSVFCCCESINTTTSAEANQLFVGVREKWKIGFKLFSDPTEQKKGTAASYYNKNNRCPCSTSMRSWRTANNILEVNEKCCKDFLYTNKGLLLHLKNKNDWRHELVHEFLSEYYQEWIPCQKSLSTTRLHHYEFGNSVEQRRVIKRTMEKYNTCQFKFDHDIFTGFKMPRR